MKTSIPVLILLGILSSTAFSYEKQLPSFSLKDPAGKTFTQKDVLEEGLVLVVTAPIMSHQSFQEGWDDKLRAAKKGKGKLVFLEDMTPSSFKKKALKSMKKDYKEGTEPILLIDNNGKVRAKIGAKKKEKVVLVYDSDGKLIYTNNEKPSTQAATKIWGALNK